MCRYICGASRPAGSISSTLIPSSSAYSMTVLCMALLCRDGRVPGPASPAVRAALVERAAEMLVRREPVTLRALVEGTGASTMAVYTHFGGMPGLWRAVRQEGFTRLAHRLAGVPATDDPIADLAALGADRESTRLNSSHANISYAVFCLK